MILIFILLGFLFLAYLFIAGAATSNYYFWRDRCKNCKHFSYEIKNIKEIFCDKHEYRNVDEMETCQDYSINKKLKERKE